MQEDRSGSDQQPPEDLSAWAAPTGSTSAGSTSAGSAGDAGEQVPPPDGDADQARDTNPYPVPGDGDASGAAGYGGSGFGTSGAGYGAGGYGAGEYGAGGSGYGAGGSGYGYPGSGYQGGGQPGGGYPGGYPGGGYPGGGYQGGGPGYGGYPPGDPGYGMPGGYGGPPVGYGQQRPKRANRVITYVLVAALAAGVGAGTVLAMRHNSSSTSGFALPGANSGPQGGSAGNGGASRSATQAVVNAVSPGIVNVISYPSYQPGGTLEGTGMVLSSNGIVLTNNHVVEGTSREKAIVADDPSEKYSVTVLGTDATDDVALLKLNGASNLKTVPIGNSSTVRLGQPVVALGNAEGADTTPAVVTGTITDLDRSIQASDPGAATTENLHGMLQTDAPIVEGDSGGPLASTQGKVIGMDTAANTGTTGAPGASMGFAIPINRARMIAEEILSHSSNRQIQFGYPAFLGVTVASMKSGSRTVDSTSTSPRTQLRQLQQQANASQSQGLGGLGGNGGASSHGCLASDQASAPSSVPDVSTGVLVGGVLCHTPADQAGMTAGAVITGVGGNAVTSPASLTEILSQYRPGETVSVTWVSKSGQHHTSSLKLAAGPAK